MDYADLGFITGKNRFRILEILNSGFATPRQISHKLRIPEPLVTKTLQELVNREFIKRDEEGYVITGKGLKMYRHVSGQGR